MKKILIGIGLLAFSTGASAQMMLQKALIASGGGISSGLILKSNITIGQPLVGVTSNSTQKAQLGFWTSAIVPPKQGVGVLSTVGELSIQSSPNPATQECRVTLTGATEDVDIRLFDLTGKEVKLVYAGAPTVTTHRFSVGDLPAGTYVLAARSPNKLAEKLITVLH